MKKIITQTLLGVALITSASGAVIVVDYDSEGVLLDGASAGKTELVDDASITTCTGISILNNSGDDSIDNGGRFISNDNNGGRLTDGDIVFDGVGDRGHVVITISGLISGNTYDISAATNGANNNFDTIFQLAGVNQTATFGGTTADFTGIAADASGNIEFIATRVNNNDGKHITIGSISVTGGFKPVPEPSSTALLGLGGLALIMRRRK